MCEDRHRARESAILYPFEETRKALYEGAKRAMAAIPGRKPYRLDLPFKAGKQSLVQNERSVGAPAASPVFWSHDSPAERRKNAGKAADAPTLGKTPARPPALQRLERHRRGRRRSNPCVVLQVPP